MTTELKTCKPVKVMTDCFVVIEPAGLHFWRTNGETHEQTRERVMKEWAKEFEAFVRDHRSQDVNCVEVRTTHEVQCSVCCREFEEVEFDAEDGTPAYKGCAYCGAKVE